MKSILAVLFSRLWRHCTSQRAIKAARRHVTAYPELILELVSDVSTINDYYLPQELSVDDCWFFHVGPLPGEGLRVGASRVLCLRKKDCAVVFDRYCGE
ncbi:MAG: hypothetical protein ABIJ50_05895 [Pseudomonadota bacterium]